MNDVSYNPNKEPAKKITKNCLLISQWLKSNASCATEKTGIAAVLLALSFCVPYPTAQCQWIPAWSSWFRPRRMPTFHARACAASRRSGRAVRYAISTVDISVPTSSSKGSSGRCPQPEPLWPSSVSIMLKEPCS